MGKRMNWDRAKKRRLVSESELDRRLERDANRFLNRNEGKTPDGDSKPWSFLQGGAQLEAFLGSCGVRTSLIGTTKYLIELAAKLFEMRPTDTPAEIAAKINALGAKERGRLAKKHLNEIMVEIGQSETKKPVSVPGTGRGVGEPAKLLHQVVMAVINHGQAHILADCPEVAAYYGGRYPEAAEFAERVGLSGGGHTMPDGRVVSYAIASFVKGTGHIGAAPRT